MDDKDTLSARVSLVFKSHIKCSQIKICGKSCNYIPAATYQNLFKTF
jgi:hypothetical protein